MSYEKPLNVKSISILETYHAGAVTKVSLKNPSGQWDEVYSCDASDITRAQIFEPTLKVCPRNQHVHTTPLQCWALLTSRGSSSQMNSKKTPNKPLYVNIFSLPYAVLCSASLYRAVLHCDMSLIYKIVMAHCLVYLGQTSNRFHISSCQCQMCFHIHRVRIQLCSNRVCQQGGHYQDYYRWVKVLLLIYKSIRCRYYVWMPIFQMSCRDWKKEVPQ